LTRDKVTALRARDVDLLRGRLLVQQAYSDIRGRLVLGPPKSGKARELPLPGLLRGPLADRLAAMDDPDGLLFTAHKGGPVRYSRFRKDVFDPAVKAAKLTGLTPHGLRHTYAALAVQSGANPKVLQEAMGHSDIRLTLDTYGGLFGDDLDALGASLGEAAERGARRVDVPNVFPLAAAGDVKG
jgi:integrase